MTGLIMANTYSNIFQRSSNHIGSLADYLYKEVLLFIESDDVTTLKGINDINKSYISLLQGEVLLDHLSEIVVSAKPQHLKDTIDVENLNDVIHLVSSTQNLAVDVLKHIRNAFAHNLVVMEDKDVAIGDFLTKRHNIDFNRPTMLGRLSIKKLKFLVKQAKSLSK